MDFHAKSSMGWDMAGTDDEIGPIKVRTGLFALITARLEDAHEIAVKGQAANANAEQVAGYITEIRSNLDEMVVHLNTIELIKNL